jgi:DNA polymerase
MGNSATGYFMKRLGLKPINIGLIHGEQIEPEKSSRVVLFPLYHPAAALYNKDLEKVLEKDFFAFRSVLERF